jgi:hypothetical protein
MVVCQFVHNTRLTHARSALRGNQHLQLLLECSVERPPRLRSCVETIAPGIHPLHPFRVRQCVAVLHLFSVCCDQVPPPVLDRMTSFAVPPKFACHRPQLCLQHRATVLAPGGRQPRAERGLLLRVDLDLLVPRSGRYASLTQVVVTGPFIKKFPCNHSVNINIIIFFFRRSKRQRNFSLFYFASQES